MAKESVWDYPRPPKLERTTKKLKVICDEILIGETVAGYRVLETSHPPVYYLPQKDLRMDLLKMTPYKRSFCEFKGSAVYWDLFLPGKKFSEIAWSYPTPNKNFLSMKDHLAFYASKVQACYVDDELVQAQEGDFYGGWITKDITGPFKGGPGTWGW